MYMCEFSIGYNCDFIIVCTCDSNQRILCYPGAKEEEILNSEICKADMCELVLSDRPFGQMRQTGNRSKVVEMDEVVLTDLQKFADGWYKMLKKRGSVVIRVELSLWYHHGTNSHSITY
jgi:hypothetical protein